MAAPRKYKSPKKFDEAVERYFLSITRQVTVTEQKATENRDDKGHVIYEAVPVINSLGEEVRVTEYIVPPSVYGLYTYLGISESTWNNYCDASKHPEFLGTIARARGRMRAWNEMQLLTRSGKDLKGIIFNLENNYGYRERMEVSSDSLESYLQRMAEEDGGQQF